MNNYNNLMSQIRKGKNQSLCGIDKGKNIRNNTLELLILINSSLFSFLFLKCQDRILRK